MYRQLGRGLAIEGDQEFLELDRAMAAVEFPMTLPVVRSSAA
jgi:hypothetical protein